jgi:hypothetical protein
MMMSNYELLLRLSQHLKSEHKPIEAGWIKIRARLIPDDTPQDAADTMRFFFFAGALHVFEHITDIEGLILSEEEYHQRLNVIKAELADFLERTIALHLPTKGNA